MRATWLIIVSGACGFSTPGVAIDAAEDDAPVVDAPPADVGQPLDGPRADWWDASWHHRRLVEIDTTKITGPLDGFPILVRLTSATIDYQNVRADGTDIRFVTFDNTTTIPFELESYTGSGETRVWLRMSLTPGITKPKLWMYYGNQAAVTSLSSGAAVFAPGHVSVHHLGSLLTDSAGAHDASSAPLSTPPIAPGRIGSGRDFDGVDDYLELATSDIAFDFITTMSASAWVKIDDYTIQYQAIVCKGDKSWRMHRGGTGNGAGFGTTNANNNDNLNGTQNIDNNQFHHVAVVLDSARKRLYIDGVEELSAAYGLQLDNTNRSVRIGMNDEANVDPLRHWNGVIDEVRISGLVRTAAWIAAEYMTVTDGAFVLVGPNEPY